MPFKLKRGRGGQQEKCRSVQEKYGGLSEGTVFAKETKEPNNRVLLGALLLGFIVFFFCCTSFVPGTYRRNQIW